MSSLRRINASRANAARSRGPITAEGKQRSSANAIRYDLLAECVVLEDESSESFNDLVTQYTERFAPADAVELGMVEEMAVADWRMRRARAIENHLMEEALRNQPPGDEAARIAAAAPELNRIHRYEAHLHRIYRSARLNLVLLRQCELPNKSHFQIPGGAGPPARPRKSDPSRAA
jgi:hypothetical protein